MYLVKRHQTWWALHDVPTALHHSLGRRLSRSLGTTDEAEAKRLAEFLMLHDWSRKLKPAATARSGDAEAGLFRDMVKNAKSDDERDLLKDYIAELAEDRFEKAKDAAGRETALRFNEAAQGRLTPLGDHLDDWLTAIGDTKKNKDMKRSTVLKLAQEIPYAQEVTRESLQKWLAATAKTDGVSRKTLGRILSSVRGYWKHLKSQSVVTGNPFEDLEMPQTRRAASWLPLSPAEVVDLATKARESGDTELASLITLGMWSGARIEELCSLKVTDVKLATKSFLIQDAKTEAGIREVPIHYELMPALRALIGDRTEGYVLAGLLPNKYGDRSNAVGKRFGRLKKAAGFSERFVFHSIRKSVGTQLENALVPEGITADILGHEKPNITYGIYSGGASLEVKRAALASLQYPS